MSDGPETGRKSLFERFASFARLMFRARATELGMSSEETIQERLEEHRERQEQGSKANGDGENPEIRPKEPRGP